MLDLTGLGSSLDGAVLTSASPRYEAIRRPADMAFHDIRPAAIVRCASVADVTRALAFVVDHDLTFAVRGGGHCFAGRSSTDGILLDLADLDRIVVDPDGVATIGAGARLASTYAALHHAGRTLPAGCGATVGIAGLTLGGGIGLLGRAHGLTCDQLVGATVVLADGSVVDCDDAREPDLFWGLRGAGGCQFGIVTELRFRTIAEPTVTRIEAHWTGVAVDELIDAWQAWAPDAPEQLTLNLAVTADPGEPVRAGLVGASLLDEDATADLVRPFAESAGIADVEFGRVPYHRLKSALSDPRDAPARPHRIRSEFFSASMPTQTVRALAAALSGPGWTESRQFSFTAMGGAYNRVAEDATAFAHRNERFLLEHIGDRDDPWVDRSWEIAHTMGSGRVYPNFPDPALTDPAVSYHAGNLARLTAVKDRYDPGGVFG